MDSPRLKLERLRCVECEKGTIEKSDDAFQCTACGSRIDSIEGVPFPGNYESADLLGLIEIAAVKEVGADIDADSVERVEKLCQGYFESGENSAWLEAQEDPFASEYWFPYRYSEWRDFHLVAKGIQWEGAKVLDVGAGVGYDAIRYLRMGSDVTGIEYNPASIERGIRSVPEVFWVGGFSHLLPFRDEQFDVICVNAALHHMRDVKQAFKEMFRALKVGGTLLTSGDPFRPLNSTERYELNVFDSHPAVLGGVNEGIPNLEVFLDPIVEFGDAVSGFAVTHALKSPPDGKDSTDLGKGYRKWELKDLPGLGGSSGSIALHLRKTGKIELKPSLQTDHIIRAGVYHDALSDLSRTMDLICPVLPDDAVNRPVVPGSQSWFDLLNGWKAPRSLENWRRGFGRGRWFLEKEGGLSGVSFKLGWNGEGEAEFDFLLNGKSVQKTTIISRQGFSIGRLLFRLREKVKPAGIAGRILRRLVGLYPSEKPFHVCQVYFDAPVPGRTAFEIRNLNSSTPDFTVSNRVLL